MIKDKEKLNKILNTRLRPKEKVLLKNIKETFFYVKDKKENTLLIAEKGLQILDVPRFIISKYSILEPISTVISKEIYKFFKGGKNIDYVFYKEELDYFNLTNYELNSVLKKLKTKHEGTIIKYNVIQIPEIVKLEEKEKKSVYKFINWLKENRYENKHFLAKGLDTYDQYEIWVNVRKIKFFNIF